MNDFFSLHTALADCLDEAEYISVWNDNIDAIEALDGSEIGKLIAVREKFERISL
ncbi:MAG: hypothetical protein ABJN40_13355 [Sneathiella sp.]